MNKNIFNILMKYSHQSNDKETRAKIVRELGAELLSSSPTFKGIIVDKTSLVEEKMGLLNFKINYKNREYDLREFRKLSGLK